MAYNKLNLQNGTKLNADHLRHIEDGIDMASQEAARAVKTINGQTPDESGNVTVEIPSAEASVTSVNGKTGDVALTAEDVGAASREEVDKLSEEIEKIKEEGGISGGTTITETGVMIVMDCEEGQEIAVSGETTEVVTLVHQGRNFQPVPHSAAIGTKNGITAEVNEDGCFVFSGVATASTFFNFDNFATPIYYPPGTYTVHCDWPIAPTESAIVQFTLVVDGDPLYQRSSKYPSDFTFTLEQGVMMGSYLKFDSGAAPSGVMRISIEYGSVYSGNFEPYRREAVEVTLPHTLAAKGGRNVVFTETDDVLTATVSKTVAQIIDEAVVKHLAVDLTAYGVPMLKLKGETAGMTKDDAVTLEYTYGDLSGICTVKWQGSSSLAYPKKNYTIKFDNEFEAAEGWGAQTKYCFKANYIDFSHSRNVVSAKLWGQIVKSRSTVPNELANLPNGGAIDGFPCVIILNGEFHGLYTFNIPKDGWMYGMGSGTNECILCADAHTESNQFRAEATLDGDFDIEYITDEANTEWAKTSLNNLINACIATDGSDLDTTIAGMLDWQSAIDYYIFCVLLRGSDMLDKNYLISTYNGVKWFFGAYDMDSTYGLHWDGLYFVPARREYTFAGAAYYNRVFELIKTYKADELKARYMELRENILSVDNVALAFLNFAGGIHRAVLDEDCRRWPTIPNTATNSIGQIVEWYRVRCERIDAEIEALA